LICRRKILASYLYPKFFSVRVVIKNVTDDFAISCHGTVGFFEFTSIENTESESV
jgi:hypothetical protein